jgi:hypothetical protein
VTRWTALALTLAIEVPLTSGGLVALRVAGWRRAILLAAAVNLITQPVLWTVLAPRPHPLALGLAEALVCIAESALLRLALRRDLPALLVLSTAANTASAAAGMLLSGTSG